jgi:hypothetical protein
MATTIITGRDLTLTIDSDDYGAQVQQCTLTRTPERSTYDVLDGETYKTLKFSAELSLEMFQDWGASPSLCEALWNAADSAPDTPIAATLVANTGATFTFDVLPVFPDAGGTAPSELMTSLTFTVVDGSVNLA